MKKVEGDQAPKKEDFKESFIRITRDLNLLKGEELDRVIKACEEQDNYSGLINQSFGAMAKRFHQMHERKDELFGTALPILTGLCSDNEAVINSDDLAGRAIAIAKDFIQKVKAEAEEESKK